jgi:hypothetical protein
MTKARRPPRKYGIVKAEAQDKVKTQKVVHSEHDHSNDITKDEENHIGHNSGDIETLTPHKSLQNKEEKTSIVEESNGNESTCLPIDVDLEPTATGEGLNNETCDLDTPSDNNRTGVVITISSSVTDVPSESAETAQRTVNVVEMSQELQQMDISLDTDIAPIDPLVPSQEPEEQSATIESSGELYIPIKDEEIFDICAIGSDPSTPNQELTDAPNLNLVDSITKRTRTTRALPKIKTEPEARPRRASLLAAKKKMCNLKDVIVINDDDSSSASTTRSSFVSKPYAPPPLVKRRVKRIGTMTPQGAATSNESLEIVKKPAISPITNTPNSVTVETNYNPATPGFNDMEIPKAKSKGKKPRVPPPSTRLMRKRNIKITTVLHPGLLPCLDEFDLISER